MTLADNIPGSFVDESQTYYKNFTDFELFKLNSLENLQSEDEQHSSEVNSYCSFIIDSLKTALIGSSKDIMYIKGKKTCYVLG